MTDEKNIKALEDYIKENEFEYFHSNMMSEHPLIKKSLDIINRQKAENEALYQINAKSEKILEVLKAACWEDLIGKSVYVVINNDMQVIGFMNTKRTKSFLSS